MLGLSEFPENLTPAATAKSLPRRRINAVADELHMPVTEECIHSAGASTAGGNVQRQSIPPVVRANTVRQPSSAINVRIIWRTHMIIHAMPWGSVEPPASSCLLQQKSGSVTLTGIVR